MSGSATVYKSSNLKRRSEMLFMTIVTWEPEKRDEVRKRFEEKGTVTGGKIIGQWSAIAGGRSFRLVEVEDPKGMFAASNVWNDIAKLEVIPVIEREELTKLLAGKK